MNPNSSSRSFIYRVLTGLRTIGIDLFPVVERGRNAILRPIRTEMAKEVTVIDEELAAVRDELGNELAALRNEIGNDLAALRNEMGNDLAALQNELKNDLAALRSEMGNDLAAVHHDLKTLSGRITEYQQSYSAAIETERHESRSRLLLLENALIQSVSARGDFKGAVPSEIFDEHFYLMTYPDVAVAGENPFEHYLFFGRFEKRRPSAIFDPMAYAEANPDVASKGIEPFLHYALIVLQGRSLAGSDRQVRLAPCVP